LDSALFITKLPMLEHDTEEWRAAIQVLLLVVRHAGPTMFARHGIMRALNRRVVREFNSSRKVTHKEKWICPPAKTCDTENPPPSPRPSFLRPRRSQTKF
jgi:hypothetical protein